MTRLRADLLLLLTAIIWGGAFVAQKTGMAGLGPFGFVGVRFTLSFFAVLPFAWREARNGPVLTKRDWQGGALLGLIFFTGVVLQQTGLLTTTVTNAGFITSLYVVIVPFIAWGLFRRRPRRLIWPACALALLGVWLLNGAAALTAFHAGDWLTLGCAVFFSMQVPLLGLLVQRTGRPLAFVLLQYAFCAALALPLAWLVEGGVSVMAVQSNLLPLLYTGLISGGVAYTLQAVAQQYTPPADAAIIMAGEALFAALFGALLLEDHLTRTGLCGCGLILLAIGLVEAGGLMAGRLSQITGEPSGPIAR